MPTQLKAAFAIVPVTSPTDKSWNLEARFTDEFGTMHIRSMGRLTTRQALDLIQHTDHTVDPFIFFPSGAPKDVR